VVDRAERNRLIAITRGFTCLQGLVYSPTGIALCFSILMDWTLPKSGLRDLTKLLVLLAGIGAPLWAMQYYRRRFGLVRHNHKPWRTLLILVTALALLWGAAWLDINRTYTISFEALWWVLFYIVYSLLPFGTRSYSRWFAGFFLVLALLPLTGAVSKDQFLLGRSTAGEFITWFAFSLHGLLDHQLLLRLLPPAEQGAQQHV
jgi:hypothetical protein